MNEHTEGVGDMSRSAIWATAIVFLLGTLVSAGCGPAMRHSASPVLEAEVTDEARLTDVVRGRDAGNGSDEIQSNPAQVGSNVAGEKASGSSHEPEAVALALEVRDTAAIVGPPADAPQGQRVISGDPPSTDEVSEQLDHENRTSGTEEGGGEGVLSREPDTTESQHTPNERRVFVVASGPAQAPVAADEPSDSLLDSSAGSPPHGSAPGLPTSHGTQKTDVVPSPGGETTVRLLSTATSAIVGESLEFTVWIERAHDVAGVPLLVTFDPSILRFVRAGEGPFLGADGNPTGMLARATSDGASVAIGLARRGRSGGVSGSGILCRLYFEVLSPGEATVGFGASSVRSPELALLPAVFIPVSLSLEH